MGDEPVKIIDTWYWPDSQGWDMAIVRFSCGHKCCVVEPDEVKDLKVCPVCKRRIDNG